MRVLLAFDKFKDSMTAYDACLAAYEAIKASKPTWQISSAPLTDGGEGFCEILTASCKGRFQHYSVKGSRFAERKVKIGYVHTDNLSKAVKKLLALPKDDGEIAIIEMAQSSGLEELKPRDRNPWLTSSYGTGQLIATAKAQGAIAILLGIGGSATNDLGLGALEAMGLELLDKNATPIQLTTPHKWKYVKSISIPNNFSYPPIHIACDVKNPLLGSNGATQVYGPQKGLAEDQLEIFETIYAKIAKLLCKTFRQTEQAMDIPGAGAAGGISFGLNVACCATLVNGFELVKEWLRLYNNIENADLIISGEGKWDKSSVQGKAPGQLLDIAHSLNKKILIFAGKVEHVKEQDKELIMAISPPDCSLKEALKQGKQLLAKSVTQAIKDL